jgi:hypothetical protein
LLFWGFGAASLVVCWVLGVGFDCDEGGERVFLGRRLSRVWLYSGRTCRGCSWAIGGTTLPFLPCWRLGLERPLFLLLVLTLAQVRCLRSVLLDVGCWCGLSVVDARCLAQHLSTLLTSPPSWTSRLAHFADSEDIQAACVSSMAAVLRSVHRLLCSAGQAALLALPPIASALDFPALICFGKSLTDGVAHVLALVIVVVVVTTFTFLPAVADGLLLFSSPRCHRLMAMSFNHGRASLSSRICGWFLLFSLLPLSHANTARGE